MTEYVVLGPHAWGSGPYEGKAFRRMVENLPRAAVESDDDLTIGVIAVEGDWEVDGMGRVEADEIVSTENLKVDIEHVRRVDELQADLGLAVEEALVEAEEVEDDE